MRMSMRMRRRREPPEYPREYGEGQRAAEVRAPKEICPYEYNGSEITAYCWWMAGYNDKRKELRIETRLAEDAEIKRRRR